MPRTTEYMIWAQMIQRCCNVNNHKFRLYGGRGITVCTSWRGSFGNFLRDMGLRPSKSHSIERINNALGYEPNNCRWATYDEQNRNNNRNRFIEWNGERKCVADWAQKFGLKDSTLTSRLDAGWSYEKAFMTPLRCKGGNQHTKKAVL